MEKLNWPFIRHFFAFCLVLVINLLLLQGCNSSSSGKSNPDPLAITTTTLPSGQIGAAYNATLVATGGTPPMNWTITNGTLPAGLKLNAATGAITGTPTATANNLALTFQVQDSGSPMQSKSVNLTLTIGPATLAISTASLPNGQVGAAYSTTLVASGGITPYNWTLISGTLPANLQLNAATGAITGTPTVSVASSPLTFQVKDAGSPQQSKTVNLSLTIISGGGITVALSPKRGGLAITQSISLTATTNDPLGVTWSANAGSFSAQASTTATYVAPSSAGTVTVTATSATNKTTNASATFGITDLAGVLTYHNDLARDGVNAQEHALTTVNVTTATFGKLFACTIDSPAYAQPLWVPNLNIAGGKHNVVLVATSHNTVYAFDADSNPCVNYWNVSLMNAGETYLNNADVSTTDIFPDIGIVGTPVIDAASGTLYLVSKSKTNGTSCTVTAPCFQRLHAVSLIDGSEKFGGPANITSAISVPGTGDGSSGGNVPFDTLRENQRPGLVLLNGVVYVAWASHGDQPPYHGWVIGFDKTSLSRVATFNANPNGSDSGIWMGGGAPAADSSGNLYFLTGNGTFDANTGGADYGDSTVKLSTSGGLSVADYFTPMDQANLSSADMDHGAGGAAILMDPSSGPVAHLLIGGGKSGVLYLLNRDNMGGFDSSTNHVVQSLVVSGNEIVATAAIWNNSLYIAASSTPLQQFPFNLTTGQFGSPSHSSSHSFGGKGATPSVSASSGSANGIVWALDSGAYGNPGPANGPAVLHAYDAANVGTELWNSTQGTGNAAGNAVKFTVPTVANGKVYVGTRSELSVYGLLPN
jgi:Putative Ig domain